MQALALRLSMPGYAIEAIASLLTARSSGVGGKGDVADLPESLGAVWKSYVHVSDRRDLL